MVRVRPWALPMRSAPPAIALLTLVLLSSTLAPVSTWAHTGELSPCCCAPADETAPTSCCTPPSPKPLHPAPTEAFGGLVPAPCLCAPPTQTPERIRLDGSTANLRLDPRLAGPSGRTSTRRRPAERTSLILARARIGDPNLPLIKNGVRGRLALLSVARN